MLTRVLFCLWLMLALGPPAGANLLSNPGFEDGWHGWFTRHPWYEAGGQGKGNGLSAWELDEKTVHSGRRSARVQGKKNRGIAIQVLARRPDRYRLSGWIRTENLDAGDAHLLAEFKDREGKYLGGQGAGSVKGTTDWTFVSQEIQVPDGTRSISIDLLTTDANGGTAWFDDVSFEDLTHDTVPPAAVRFSRAPADAGVLSVRWNPEAGEPDVAGYELFVSERPFRSIRGMLPRAVVGCDAGEASVGGLANGKTCYVRVVAVDEDGNRLLEGEPMAVVIKDIRPPRPVKVTALPVFAQGGAALVRWRPNALDADVAGFAITVRGRTRRVAASQRELLLTDIGTRPVTISVATTDSAGNTGPDEQVVVDIPRVPAAKTYGVSGMVRAGGLPHQAATVIAVDMVHGRRWEAKCDLLGRFQFPIPGDRRLRIYATAPGWWASQEALVLLRPGDRIGIGLSLSLRHIDLAAWSTSSLSNVFPDATPPEEPALDVDWMAVRGETEGAQVVLRGERPFTITDVDFDPLVPEESGLPVLASALRASVVGTLSVNKNSTATPAELLLRQAPADFPDPFLDDGPAALQPGVSRPVYILVDVPRNTRAGRYNGTAYVRVRVDSGNISQVPVPICLELAPVVLPERPTLPVTHWFNSSSLAEWHQAPLWSEPFWEVLRAYARDMAAHRQTVAMVPLDTVQTTRDPGGRFAFNFSRFDRWVELFTDAGVGQRLEIMHFGRRENDQWEDKKFVFHEFQAPDRGAGGIVPVPPAELAAAVERHLEEKGWLERAVLHIADEPIPVNVDSWRELSRAVRAGAPKAKRIDAIHVPPDQVTGDLEVMVPQLNYFDQWHDQFLAAQKAGAEVWFYIAWVPQGKYPNRLIDYPAIKTRIIPWMVFALDATGYLHWGLNFWTKELADMGFAPGDNWIVYPGAEGPRSSLRWEAFRDGLEDFELFRMLAARDPEKAREIMAEAVRGATDYETDPARLEEVRRKVIRALSAKP